MLAASWCGKGLDNLVPTNHLLKLNQCKEDSMLLIVKVFCIGPRFHIIGKWHQIISKESAHLPSKQKYQKLHLEKEYPLKDSASFHMAWVICNITYY